MDNRAIGFLDSGIGGISVLGHAIRLLPAENFIYYGDTANAPYGDKTPDEVLELTKKGVQILLDNGCKAIVIACNTATSAAAAALRQELELPVLGIEPALKPASLLPEEGTIAVMATRMTLSLPKFENLMKLYTPDALLIPCPGLMECVEAGILHGEQVDLLLDKLLEPCRNHHLKAIVLGCTHYPFLREAISRHIGRNVPLLDGGEGTARHLAFRLKEEGLTCERSTGSVSFLSSSKNPEATEKMKRMLQMWQQGWEEHSAGVHE